MPDYLNLWQSTPHRSFLTLQRFLVQFSVVCFCPISAALLINMTVQMKVHFVWDDDHCKICLRISNMCSLNCRRSTGSCYLIFFAQLKSYKDETLNTFSWRFEGSYAKFHVLGREVSLNVLNFFQRTLKYDSHSRVSQQLEHVCSFFKQHYCWRKFSPQFETDRLFGRVARGAKLKFVLKAHFNFEMATKVIIEKKWLHSKRTLLRTALMHNEWIT